MGKTTSPARRRSIAVLNTNSPARRKRRASSFGISDKHRLLAPRKSILKSISRDEDDTVSLSVATTSVSITGPRKSLKPRVSFASHAHVRLFEKKDSHSQSSSPAASPEQAKAGPSFVSDENAYPGASGYASAGASRSRRSSISNRRRSSIGGNRMSDDDGMDLDSSMVQDGGGSSESDNLADLMRAESEADDMDATTVIDRPRRSSFAPAQPRPSDAFSVWQDEDDDLEGLGPTTQEDAANLSEDMDRSGGDTIDISLETEHEEYQHPIGRGLNPPKAPSAALLELAAMTGSGQMGYDDDDTADGPVYAPNPIDDDVTDMSIDDAVSRLSLARQSTGGIDDDGMDVTSHIRPLVIGEDSFSDESFGNNMDDTVNVTTAFRNRRSSVGFGLRDDFPDTEELADIVAAEEEPLQATPNPTTFTETAAEAHMPHTPEAQTSTGAIAHAPLPSNPPPAPPTTASVSSQHPSSVPAASPSLSPSPPRRRLSLLPEPRSVLATALAPAASTSTISAASGSTSAPVSGSSVFRPRMSAMTSAASASTSENDRPRRTSLLPSAPSVASTEKAFSPPAPAPSTSATALQSEETAHSLSSSLALPSFTPSSLTPPSTTPSPAARPKSPEKRPPASSRPRHSLLPAHKADSASALRPARTASLGGPSASVFRPRISLATSTTRNSGKDVEAAPSTGPLIPASSSDEPPALSMEDFLELTDIHFMENITVPRRSVAGSRLGQPSNADPTTWTPGDYVLAMGIYVPQLEIYGPGLKAMQDKIEALKAEFARTNEEVKTVPPEAFATYLESSEEDRAAMLATFQGIKVDTRELAKLAWYESRIEWELQLKQIAEETLAAVIQDEEKLKDINARLDAEVLEQEDELADLERQIEEEEAALAEIDNDDKVYLEELKETIKEQTTMTEDLQREHVNIQDNIKALDQRIADSTKRTADHRAFIEEADRILATEDSGGMERVKELDDKLMLLQWLHGWRCVVTREDLLVVTFDDRYHVSIPQRDGGGPDLSRLSITILPNAGPGVTDEWLPGLEQFLLQAARVYVMQARDSITKNSDITRRLSAHWTCSDRLREELDHVAAKWPTTHEFSPATPTKPAAVKLTVPLLFHAVKGRADVMFTIDADVFSDWHDTVSLVKTKVSIRYGQLRQDLILKAVKDHMNECTTFWEHKTFINALKFALTVHD